MAADERSADSELFYSLLRMRSFSSLHRFHQVEEWNELTCDQGNSAEEHKEFQGANAMNDAN